MIKLLPVLLLWVSMLISHSWCNHVSSWLPDMIYRHYSYDNASNQIAFCIRRFNLTHQVGCTSSSYGNSGRPFVVHGAKQDVWSRVRQAQTPLVLLIDIVDFEAIRYLKDNSRQLANHVTGVIFHRNSSLYMASYESMSHDSACPNQNYGFRNMTHACSGGHQWISAKNPFLDFAHIDWPFPMFYVQNADLVTEMVRCADRWTQCTVQLKSFMYGAINSRRCQNRKYINFDGTVDAMCLPYEARNIFSTLLPISPEAPVKNRSVLVLTARLDAFTMFQSAPGLNSVYSSLIVMMAVANALHQHSLSINASLQGGSIKNVLFALFDAEAFGYIGSSSWLFNNNYMDNYRKYLTHPFVANFTLSKMSHVIELNQLLTTTSTTNDTIWLHQASNSTNGNNFSQQFIKFANDNKLKVEPSKFPLPPSTVEVFGKFDQSISSFLLSRVNGNFDPLYHSVFDDGHDWQIDSVVKKLKPIADTVSQFVYHLLTGAKNANVKTNAELIRNLTSCFLERSDNNSSSSLCSLFNSTLTLDETFFNQTTATRLEQVFNTMETLSNTHTQLTVMQRRLIELILFYATGSPHPCGSVTNPWMGKIILGQNHTNDDDDDGSGGSKVDNSSTCLYSQTRLQSVQSPYAEVIGEGFGESDKVDAVLKKLKHIDFSTWTESLFDANSQPAIRLFLTSSSLVKNLTLLAGAAWLALSFAGTYLVSHNYDLLFTMPGNARCSPRRIVY